VAIHNIAGDRNSAAAKGSGKTAEKSRTCKKAAAKQAASIKTGKSAGTAGEKSRRKAGRGSTKRTVALSTAPPEAGGQAAEAEPVDPFEIAKQTMRGSVPEIVKTLVKLAKEGSCPHAKTLLEMTGAKHMFDEQAESQESGEPWAKLVLERMEEAEQESSGAD
jgi:hypothetical protein